MNTIRRKILNLTQHPAAPGQGVIDLVGKELESLKIALTFYALPTPKEVSERADHIAELACMHGLGSGDDDPIPTAAMIGGAPCLMAPLERSLRAVGIEPLYSFSIRESVEEAQADGSVRKVDVFRHVGFIPAVEEDPHVWEWGDDERRPH